MMIDMVRGATTGGGAFLHPRALGLWDLKILDFQSLFR